MAEGDPLRADAVHFAPPESALVFEPRANGGLGAPAASCVLRIGAVAVGHFCKRGVQGEFELYSSAGEMIAGRRLVASRRDALELARVLAWLEESGVDPVEPERIMDGLDSRPRLMDLVEGWQLPTGSAGFLPSVQRKCTVAACSLERLHACLQSERINGQVLEQSVEFINIVSNS